jgi:hypothetical protein
VIEMSYFSTVEDRFKRLNKKIDILYITARESVRGNGRETNALNKNKLESFITRFENGEDTERLYKEWKQDLLVKYFDPRNYKNIV